MADKEKLTPITRNMRSGDGAQAVGAFALARHPPRRRGHPMARMAAARGKRGSRSAVLGGRHSVVPRSRRTSTPFLASPVKPFVDVTEGVIVKPFELLPSLSAPDVGPGSRCGRSSSRWRALARTDR